MRDIVLLTTLCIEYPRHRGDMDMDMDSDTVDPVLCDMYP